MDCDTFRANWSHWHEGWQGVDATAMAAHAAQCPACARFDDQMRAMVGTLQTLPVAGDRSTGVAGKRAARVPHWVAVGALAAMLAIGVAVGALVVGPLSGSGPTTVRAQAIAVEPQSIDRVAVRFDAPKALERVEFAVELPPGVELVGSPGKRVVRWTGALAKGANRLELPLRIRKKGELGMVVARLRHATGERKLLIPLRAGEGEGNGHV